jgi:hypothetical protein
MGGKDHANETFADFKSRFTSLAVLGEIPQSELFYYLWDKITPQLRMAAAPMKRGWNRNLSVMTADLLALDKERRRNSELNAIANKTNPSHNTSSRQVSSFKQKSGTKPFIPIKERTTTYTASRIIPTPSSSLPFDRKKPEPGTNPSVTCFNCGMAGHIKTSCPSRPTIKEIQAQEEVDDREVFEQSDSEPTLSENEEA